MEAFDPENWKCSLFIPCIKRIFISHLCWWGWEIVVVQIYCNLPPLPHPLTLDVQQGAVMLPMSYITVYVKMVSILYYTNVCKSIFHFFGPFLANCASKLFTRYFYSEHKAIDSKKINKAPKKCSKKMWLILRLSVFKNTLFEFVFGVPIFLCDFSYNFLSIKYEFFNTFFYFVQNR